ncbi:MAG: TspO/MBR family protein [bacterium]
MTIRETVVLALFILLCFGAGGLGSYWTAESVSTWYPTLRKPFWNPPNWIFGPVWSALYLAMAVAGWLVWRKAGGWEGRLALGLFGAQLVFNTLWSFLFFGMQNPFAGLVDILILWGLIAATLAAFGRIAPAAGWLFVPYLAWVSYALTLNLALWWMNR